MYVLLSLISHLIDRMFWILNITPYIYYISSEIHFVEEHSKHNIAVVQDFKAAYMWLTGLANTVRRFKQFGLQFSPKCDMH